MKFYAATLPGINELKNSARFKVEHDAPVILGSMQIFINGH